MLTLVLQNAVTALIWVFALSSVGVYRNVSGHAERERPIAWLVTAIAFGAHALNKTVQSAMGIRAFAAGEGTQAWETFMFWNPIFNHSRTFLLLAYCGVLCHLSMRRAPLSPRYLRVTGALLAAGMAAGAVLGWAEHGFTELRHYSAVARWDVVEMLVLLGTLFAGMLGTRIDRVLWGLLGVYAFSLALNVLWFAAFSRTGMPGQWAPRPWEIQVYRVILFGLMAVLALYRLRQARRGIFVPALLEPSTRRVGFG
ncbi:MAG TPA: hypothetical protein VF006_02275 [Longimicrobium sp.]